MEIRAVDGYRLYVRFEDGRAGKIDLGEIIKFKRVFALGAMEFQAKLAT